MEISGGGVDEKQVVKLLHTGASFCLGLHLVELWVPSMGGFAVTTFCQYRRSVKVPRAILRGDM